METTISNDSSVQIIKQKMLEILGNVDALETEIAVLRDENEALTAKIAALETITKDKAETE